MRKWSPLVTNDRILLARLLSSSLVSASNSHQIFCIPSQRKLKLFLNQRSKFYAIASLGNTEVKAWSFREIASSHKEGLFDLEHGAILRELLLYL